MVCSKVLCVAMRYLRYKSKAVSGSSVGTDCASSAAFVRHAKCAMTSSAVSRSGSIASASLLSRGHSKVAHGQAGRRCDAGKGKCDALGETGLEFRREFAAHATLHIRRFLRRVRRQAAKSRAPCWSWAATSVNVQSQGAGKKGGTAHWREARSVEMTSW